MYPLQACADMQIHIVQKDVHQDTKGYITVVVTDAELIKKRLAAVKEALEGTKFRCTPIDSPQASQQPLLSLPARLQQGEGTGRLETMQTACP